MTQDPVNLPIRHHHIRAMIKSPAHYIAVRLGQAEDDPSYAMERGSGLHEMLAARVPVLAWEEGRPRRGKEYEAFAAANPEALILSASDHARAAAMYAAVLADPIAAPLCSGGVAEETIQWAIPGRGLLGRTTPDRLIVEGTKATIVEVKTARTSDPDRFVWTGRRDYGYHTQAAWHAAGVLATHPHLTDVAVRIVVVESAAPHVVTTIAVSSAMLDVAAAEIHAALDRIVGCRASGQWPGYIEGVWDWLPDEVDITGSDEPDDG